MPGDTGPWMRAQGPQGSGGWLSRSQAESLHPCRMPGAVRLRASRRSHRIVAHSPGPTRHDRSPIRITARLVRSGSHNIDTMAGSFGATQRCSDCASRRCAAGHTRFGVPRAPPRSHRRSRQSHRRQFGANPHSLRSHSCTLRSHCRSRRRHRGSLRSRSQSRRRHSRADRQS